MGGGTIYGPEFLGEATGGIVGYPVQGPKDLKGQLGGETMNSQKSEGGEDELEEDNDCSANNIKGVNNNMKKIK